MTRYRVEFSDDWIKGRWGYTDRVFHTLKGRVTEPSRLENAWVVDYHGHPGTLGDAISEMLNIQKADYQKFGTIFEIIQLGEREPASARGRGKPAGRRPPWDTSSDAGRRNGR